MLLRLGHVTVRSADFERTRRFYCGLLGMQIGPRPAIEAPGHWYYIGTDAVVHVLPALQAAGQAVHAQHCEPAAFDHVAFDAQDRPAFEQRLRAAGQPFEGRPLADTHVWQIFLTDPDGVRVELSFETQEHVSRDVEFKCRD